VRGGDRPTGGIARGMSWGHPTKGRPRGVTAVAVAGLVGMTLLAPPSSAAEGRPVGIILREAPGAGDRPEALVRSLGGTIGLPLRIIDGFAASVPSGALSALAADPSVASVTPDSRVRLANHHHRDDDRHGDRDDDRRGDDDDRGGSGRGDDDDYDPLRDDGSMFTLTTAVTGAASMWADGHTGAGVDVALIDSGVVPVNGLTSQGKVINGPDLSFESQTPSLRYLDTYGHGTHMAGIIAGRDLPSTPGPLSHRFFGMAPDARVVSVKVADAHGATDVSQVIAAIDWVVQHRNDDGLDIRVLNLSFGTDGMQSYLLDPLAYAAEVAWRRGIVVVVAAGNRNYGSRRLNNPAFDPFVLTVGAADGKGTSTHRDDKVASFSSCGTSARGPDLVAPGKSVVSLRDPRSYIDQEHPEGRVGERFFRGSGTSQAAAVTSGAVALLLSQRPSLTPDQVKALLTNSAAPLRRDDRLCQGKGMLDLREAELEPTPAAIQAWPPATGLGTLEGARGTAHLTDGKNELRGEMDIFGTAWDGEAWATASLAGTSWQGGLWNGKSWSGDSWSATSWAGKSWSAVTWSGKSWSGKAWSDMSWSGKSWSGKSWSVGAWSGKSWSGKSWGSGLWATAEWGEDDDD
jgi:subtilisin family serine protease